MQRLLTQHFGYFGLFSALQSQEKLDANFLFKPEITRKTVNTSAKSPEKNMVLILLVYLAIVYLEED